MKPEEVALLVQIYLATQHAHEAIELLTGPTMSPESKVGLQDPQLILSLLLRCLSAENDLETMLNVSKKLVQNQAFEGDDRLWSTLRHIHDNGNDVM